jgi:hypothetical protein
VPEEVLYFSVLSMTHDHCAKHRNLHRKPAKMRQNATENAGFQNASRTGSIAYGARAAAQGAHTKTVKLLQATQGDPMTDSPESPIPLPIKLPKRVRGDALDRLSKAARRRVRDNSDGIAKKLVELILEGDVSSAKMVLSLIGTPIRKPAAKRPQPGAGRS